MKFRNCFIDELGRVFKDSSLFESSKDLPIGDFELVDSLMDEVIRWKLVNFHDYLIHLKRVMSADLSVPIIVRSDGIVMDGRHRILKGLLEGKTCLPSRRFEIDPIPDFNL